MELEEILKTELRGFINEKFQLTSMPSKYKKELIFAYYLATKFESGKTYSEIEVNDIILSHMTFRDSTFRRDLIDFGLLSRTNDGKSYWKNEIPSFEKFYNKHI